MRINGARIIVDTLISLGVDVVFGYPGGAVIPLFDELSKNSKKISLVQPRHEQGGIHAADGYARLTGKTGVVIVTSGPGATNTVTGIATAYMDSVPLVVITGQVSTNMIGTDAFQEVDITGITLPVTKANYLVKKAEELRETLELAFFISRYGRPGPVLVDVPADVQKTMVDTKEINGTDISDYPKHEPVNISTIKRVYTLIESSCRPVILSGGGVISSGAAKLVTELVNKFHIPVLTTLMGKGIYSADERLNLGGFGMHGSAYGNYAVQKSDLIIALGVRFSDRVFGKMAEFALGAKIVHVDIDKTEIGKNVGTYFPIVADVGEVVEKLLSISPPAKDFSDWIAEIEAQRKKYPLSYKKDGKLKPQYLIELASKIFPSDTVVVSDVGQHQMWVSQYYSFKNPRTFISSGGLGTMGFGLPAAIGAKIGDPNREVLLISGDGGFQMNIQELITVKRYGLSVKMLLFDNNSLGMVRQWQELFYGGRYVATPMPDNPDFCSVAQAFGIKSLRLEEWHNAEKAIRELASSDEAMLLHALIDPDENVFPMVPPGESLNNVLLNEEEVSNEH